MDPINILCWFWKQPGGASNYLPIHVNIWADMVSRNLTIPHTLSCVTRHPEGIDPHIKIIDPPTDFEDVRIPTWPGEKPQCLRRISMFSPNAGEVFGDRFVCMDIDSVISKNIDDLFTGGEDFKMFRGTASHRPYNGSMMMMKAGSRPQVFNQFTVKGAVEAGKRFIGSDQAWISHVLGWGEATWGLEHGVSGYAKSVRQKKYNRLMFTFGNPKPWDLVELGDQFAAEHFRIHGRGSCVYLDCGEGVWEEFQSLSEDRDFNAAFACTEVAGFFPEGQFSFVTDDTLDAKRAARMMGFEEFTICGDHRKGRNVAA